MSSRPPRRFGARPGGARAPQKGAASPRPRGNDPLAHLRGQRAVVGLHAVEEVFKVRLNRVTQLWLREGWADSKPLREFRDRAFAKGISVEAKAPAVLDRIAASNQGVCAIVSETPEWDESILTGAGPATVVILDGIEDPHNLGAILRTAWLMGAKAIFVPQERSAPLTPAAMKVASGGAEHVPVEVVPNLAHLLEKLKKHEFWAFGLAEQGRQSVWSLKLPAKIAWVIGAEDKGLRSTVASVCDELIHIPQIPSGSSYNASVAAAIVLAEGARQHEIAGLISRK